MREFYIINIYLILAVLFNIYVIIRDEQLILGRYDTYKKEVYI